MSAVLQAKKDPRVEAAISHWAPRFVANGVPPGVKVYPTRGIASPAGLPGRISATKWSCPRGDFDFFKRSPREQVPLCPTHERELQRVG